MTSQTLDAIQAGRRVQIQRLSGDDQLSRRLHDMGFWPGTTVDVICRAPLQDPTVYDLHGYRIALRRDEAARVVVGEQPAGA